MYKHEMKKRYLNRYQNDQDRIIDLLSKTHQFISFFKNVFAVCVLEGCHIEC